MVNRKQALFGLSDAQDKNFMSLMCDKADRAQKTKQAVYTKFVSPREFGMITERLLPFCDIEEFGGYDGAERKIVCFLEKDNFYGETQYPVDVLKITATNKKVYSHRDYLGSVLALGIKRELIGDIIITDCEAFMFCHNEIFDYIIYNLEKIANARVIIEPWDVKDVALPERKFKEITDTVTSLRLDCVVSCVANISRANAAETIKKGLVALNYVTNCQVSSLVGDGDVISVRGSGKYIVKSDGTLTKKGRYHIKILKYI